jgi:hypothetical protein
MNTQMTQSPQRPDAGLLRTAAGGGHSGPDESSGELRRTHELFRAVNASVAKLGEGFADVAGEEQVDFLCECGDGSCFAAVALSLEEYRELRTHPNRFVVLPGHEAPGAEEVVERRAGHLVVELGSSVGA